MNHSDVPSCADCQTWWYKEDWSINQRRGKDLKRPKNCPPLCKECPKGGPENEHYYTLSERSLEVLDLYWMHSAMPIPKEYWLQYPQLVLDMSVVHRIIESSKESKRNHALAMAGLKGLA